jgi:hypothetical protein
MRIGEYSCGVISAKEEVQGQGEFRVFLFSAYRVVLPYLRISRVLCISTFLMYFYA